MTNKNQDKMIERPPIVVIMGHIDHGKSTLLDYIRKSNIVSGEAGGITQHLGAYEVEHKGENGDMKRITFLDTPGHEAFCGVRNRGAKVADVAVLIVSAEDGVKPQTIEALESIKKDKLPYVVAINKIDSPRANVETTKNSLVENEIYLEGYGGEIPYTEISAKEGTGIDELLDLVLIVSEVEELKAVIDEPATGFVIESHKSKNKGITATLVIKGGTLNQGQFVVCNDSYAPVRIYEDFKGEPIKTAHFSTPVKVSGWTNFPDVGELFETLDSKKEAESYCEENREISNQFNKIFSKDKDEFIIPLIIKSDTHGSIEAIEHELKKVNPKNAKIKVVLTETGNITEKDIKIASGNENTLVIGFGIDIDKQAEIMRERLGVSVATFKIIYELTEWIQNKTDEIRPRLEVEEIKGKAKILAHFSQTKTIQVVGGRVEEGSIILGKQVKIMRRGEEIGRGKIKELQQQKVKATEVTEGNEFGLSVETKIEIAPGDYVETFEVVKD